MDRKKELQGKAAAGTITDAEKKELAELENTVTLSEVKTAVGTAVAEAVKVAMNEVVSKISEIIASKQAPGFVQDPGSKQSFKEILMGIKYQNRRIIDKYKLQTAKKVFGDEEKTLTEGIGGGPGGGFLVPIEQSNKIINLITEKSIIRQILTKLGNVWPMSSMTQTVPVVTVNLTAFWITEEGAKTPNDPTFAQMLLTAYKLCCLTGISDELLADSDPRVDTLLYNLFAMAMIRGEETAFVRGTGAAPADPITGIYNFAGITTLPYSGDLMDDFADGIGTVEENDGEAVTVLHALREKRKMRKMKDDDGQYIYQKPADKNTPATIWDADAIGDKYIPTNLGVGLNQSFAICGDFNFAHIGDRAQVEIASSNEWCFDHDQTWFRAVRRVAFRLSDPTKFVRITGITMA